MKADKFMTDALCSVDPKGLEQCKAALERREETVEETVTDDLLLFIKEEMAWEEAWEE